MRVAVLCCPNRTPLDQFVRMLFFHSARVSRRESIDRPAMSPEEDTAGLLILPLSLSSVPLTVLIFVTRVRDDNESENPQQRPIHQFPVQVQWPRCEIARRTLRVSHSGKLRKWPAGRISQKFARSNLGDLHARAPKALARPSSRGGKREMKKRRWKARHNLHGRRAFCKILPESTRYIHPASPDPPVK